MWHCLGLNSEPFMPMSKPPRFFTPLRSVQNDIIIHCLLTVTSYKRADTRVRPYVRAMGTVRRAHTIWRLRLTANC